MDGGLGMLACAFGDGVEEEMGREGGHLLLVQRGSFPPSALPAPRLVGGGGRAACTAERSVIVNTGDCDA